MYLDIPEFDPPSSRQRRRSIYDQWVESGVLSTVCRWPCFVFSSPEPKAVVIVRRPHFQTNISEASWPVLIKFYGNITGMGEMLHKVLGQIASKLWFPWQQKAPIDL